MKQYFAGKVDNMRDIGGYETPYGKIPYGRFIRSNWLPELPAEGEQFLRQLGITTAIDLRSVQECEEDKSVFENIAGIKFYNFPFQIGLLVPASTDEIAPAYLRMSEDIEIVKNILNTIFNAPGGVIYYCHAGKDRTGVVTALIMLILGVSDDDIVADYMLTEKYLCARLHEWAVLYDLDEKLIFPQAVFMRDFLKLWREKYHDIDNYLRQMNLNTEQLRQKIFKVG